MGFFQGIGSRVRSLMGWDKERVALQLAKGGTSSSYPQTGFDLMQAQGFDMLSDYLKLEQDLMSRYVDYEEMDEIPEISSALDAFADDSTLSDALQNHVVWVDSADRTVKEVITDLYHARLRIDEDLWPMSRGLNKYGSEYSELLVTNDGVVGLNYLPQPTMRRIEGRSGELFGFIQDFKGRTGFSPDEFRQLLSARAAAGGNMASFDRMTAFEDWEVVHMRLMGKQRRSMYGFSQLDAARWIAKRLMLLEDSAMMYRLTRSAERYAFYIDVGNMPPKEAYAYLNKVRQQYKKSKYFNSSTGKMDLKAAIPDQLEDIFIATRDGQASSKIDVLGSPVWQSVEDLNFFRMKLFAALKVPKQYLGYDAPLGKNSNSDDVRFARAVLRVQRELRNGLQKIGRVHLAALGVDPNRVEYEVYMTVPSSIFELAQLEVRNAKADFAGRMSQFVSMHWILKKIFGMTDEEVEYIIKERHEEQLQDAEIQAKAMGMAAQEQGDVQMQQQAQQAQLMGGAQQAQLPAPQKENLTSLSRIWPQRRQQLGYRPITERELMAGNRDHEKRLEDNFEQLIKNDAVLAGKLSDLQGLVNDLRSSRPARGR